MCVASSGPVLKDPLSKALFTGDSGLAKFSSKVDPLGAYLATGNKGKLDPLNLSNAPDPLVIPPPPQDAKEPDSMGARRRARNPNASSSTILTGPRGVSAGALTTGGTTLLGG